MHVATSACLCFLWEKPIIVGSQKTCFGSSSTSWHISDYTKIVSFSSLHFPPWLILINTMQGVSHDVNLALSDDINHITEQYNDT